MAKLARQHATLTDDPSDAANSNVAASSTGHGVLATLAIRITEKIVGLAARSSRQEDIWQKTSAGIFRARLIDGSRSALHGQLWRRKINGAWQYRQDAESDEEILDRQW